jgi:hypothetical protein
MIPKIAHFYWGGDFLPYMRYLTIVSFIRYNPDWQVILYIPKTTIKEKSWGSHEQKYSILGKNYLTELKSLPIQITIFDFESIGISNSLSEVHKSDFLRWYLLYTVGGLWSDMDILYFKPIPAFTFDVGICICPYGHSIGFLPAKARSLYYKKVLQTARSFYDKQKYQGAGATVLNRYFKRVSDILISFKDCIYHNLSMDIVYAYDAKNIKQIFCSRSASKFTKNSIGIHWYAGDILAGKFMNGKGSPCLLEDLCKKEGYDMETNVKKIGKDLQ